MYFEYGLPEPGVKPEFLIFSRDIITNGIKTDVGWVGGDIDDMVPPEAWAWKHQSGTPNIIALRFREGHWAVPTLKWNKENPKLKPFIPYHYPGTSPDDWDGKEVLVEDSYTGARILQAPLEDSWYGTTGYAPVIGYRSKEQVKEITDVILELLDYSSELPAKLVETLRNVLADYDPDRKLARQIVKEAAQGQSLEGIVLEAIKRVKYDK